MFNLNMRIGIMLCCLICIGLHASAQDSSEVLFTDVPKVFSKITPNAKGDLRVMQEHLRKIVLKLKECTVHLQIGRAQGSGVLASADGLILTAAHVSGPPGRRVIVTTNDGNEFVGKTLGRNTTLDASLIQLESDRTDWPHCTLGDSEKVELGDWCITLGHPGGIDPDRGLVLRLGRIIFKSRWILQTDCELVGGDSGGPLFDMAGRIIGINTQIQESTNANFHVPASAYTDGWDRLLAGESFRSHSGAYLGVTCESREGEGVTITTVYPGDPADRAGLKVGDILLKFQNQKVSSLKDLIDLVGEEPVGKTVQLDLVRDEEPITINLRLGMRFD